LPTGTELGKKLKKVPTTPGGYMVTVTVNKWVIRLNSLGRGFFLKSER
jgi:hypothetical protein